MMKTTKATCFALAAALLISSCSSSYQAQGGVTGALIGSRVGETIGFLSGHGHFRGENAALGSLIGMGVGAVLGVGIASQIEQGEQIGQRPKRTDRYDETPDYQTGSGAYAGTIPGAVSISDLTYMDSDGDGLFSKNETLEVEGFITNTSNEPLKDIVIFLKSDNTKDVSISPSLTTTLRPGQKIRYTGRLHCKKAHNGKTLSVTLNTFHSGKVNTSGKLNIKMTK